jgi:hypothetical protein
VFRVSSAGALQKVLDANLKMVAEPRVSAALGFDADLDGQFAALFSATYNGSPAIGVLGKQGGNMVFEYLNANTLTPQWKVTLANGVSPLSVMPLPGAAVSYVDPNQAAIQKTTASGTTTVWKLNELDPGGNPFNVRILVFAGGTSS